MKFLITNIKYSIEQEDIDAYREDENIDDEVTDEEIVEEIKKSLPQHLVVEVDNYSDYYDEEMTDAISDATGWCIEEFTEQSLLEFVTSKLNNFMQTDHEFWEENFSCETHEIFNQHRFGCYDGFGKEEQLAYLSKGNIIDVDIPAEEVADKIIKDGNDVDALRKIIFWIYEMSE